MNLIIEHSYSSHKVSKKIEKVKVSPPCNIIAFIQNVNIMYTLCLKRIKSNVNFSWHDALYDKLDECKCGESWKAILQANWRADVISIKINACNFSTDFYYKIHSIFILSFHKINNCVQWSFPLLMDFV